MCGIAGQVGPHASAASDLVAGMLSAIHHRGPDGEGLYSGHGVTLGHRRLAILDLSRKGAQPMIRGELAVSYNGEIYNYLELRAQLRERGQDFHTDTDTEVLLAAYSVWGLDCVSHFDGMWAFALHDRARRVVFCSRDRFGEKPFLFNVSGSTVTFASEAKQFHAVGLGREPDRDGVRDFLAFGGKTDVRATYYQGIQSLPPGTNMLISCETGALSSDTYYAPGSLGLFAGIADEDVPEVFSVEFQRAVTARLRSDVSVGMLLSGGIDSSLIASVAGPAYREATGEALVALTAQTGDPRNDESVYARAVAESAGLAWEPVHVSAAVTRATWAEATRIIEQPLSSSSHALQLKVMSRAKDYGCTVILDGQGADESWLGYPRYTVAALRDVPLQSKPAFAWRTAETTGLGPLQWLAYRVYFGLPEVALVRLRRRLDPLGIRVTDDWFHERHAALSGRRGMSVRDLQTNQLAGEQLGALLRYADRTSMAVSIEDRLPFLDFRLVELALECSTRVKFRDGWTKWPLRQQLALTVPSAVAWRKGKIGFEAAATAFQPNDAAALRLIRASDCLGEMGIRRDRVNELHRSVLWRLFAIALWEAELLGAA